MVGMVTEAHEPVGRPDTATMRCSPEGGDEESSVVVLWGRKTDTKMVMLVTSPSVDWRSNSRISFLAVTKGRVVVDLQDQRAIFLCVSKTLVFGILLAQVVDLAMGRIFPVVKVPLAKI